MFYDTNEFRSYYVSIAQTCLSSFKSAKFLPVASCPALCLPLTDVVILSAHHTDCTFIRVSGAELVQKYIGEVITVLWNFLSAVFIFLLAL